MAKKKKIVEFGDPVLDDVLEAVRPILARMIRDDGWEYVRQLIYVYSSTDRSWNRRMNRILATMPIRERIRWRQAFSNARIAGLDQMIVLSRQGKNFRRALLQRLTTALIQGLLRSL